MNLPYLIHIPFVLFFLLFVIGFTVTKWNERR